MDRYGHILMIFTDTNISTRYRHTDGYGQIWTIFTHTNIWTDIDILTDMDRYERYSYIQTYEQILTY